MKIHIANKSKQQLGGGFTFIRNFTDALGTTVDLVECVEDCDIYFIPSASMVERSDVEFARQMKKKVVLRVDNIPRNSRNRNTGTSRLYDFAQAADGVIYQSAWAQDYVGYFLNVDKKSVVIHNGVNMDYFHPNGRTENTRTTYLYVHYNRDENKRFPEAAMDFHYKWRKDKNIRLMLIGRFSKELIQSNFDFYMNEPFKWVGVIEDPQVMGNMMRQCDVLLYPSFSDACPNTMIEALACGLKVEHKGHASMPEIQKAFDDHGIEYFSLQNMGKKYLELFERILL